MITIFLIVLLFIIIIIIKILIPTKYGALIIHTKQPDSEYYIDFNQIELSVENNELKVKLYKNNIDCKISIKPTTENHASYNLHLIYNYISMFFIIDKLKCLITKYKTQSIYHRIQIYNNDNNYISLLIRNEWPDIITDWICGNFILDTDEKKDLFINTIQNALKQSNSNVSFSSPISL